MLKRPMYRSIWSELSHSKPMVFLSGPRQSGKTTLARMIASEFANRIYFNWDYIEDRKRLIKNPAFFEEISRKDSSQPLVILDEIHKYKKWKNYLKGVYDQYSDRYRFFVLGSGRLNEYKKGGDSLAGRYLHFTIWPFTLAELAGHRLPTEKFISNPLEIPEYHPNADKIWNSLDNLSGFPEPYLSGKKTAYRRWSRNYHQQLIREDIRNLTELKDIDHIEILFSILPSKIGSPLSMANIARDLQVSFNSVKKWIKTFESFYLIFFVRPWTRKISRAITKEKKLYLFDYANIPSEAARFENMVALELFRAVSNWNDLGLGYFDLHYLRNKEKEEVDFLISQENKPFLLIETKSSDDSISPSLAKFQSVLKVPAVQLVNKPDICKIIANGAYQILVISAPRWLQTLP